MSAIVWQFEHSLALPFYGIGMKTDIFQSCGHCGVFQICWHIECSTFTALSFGTWSNSARIPSLPLAVFIMMLPKAHLTLHSRISGSRWVVTPSWLSGSWRTFLHSFSLYSCHLFLISSASVRSYHFCHLLCPSLHEIFLWYLWFSWRDLQTFPFYCFPLFLCIDHWGRLSYLSLLFSGTCIQMHISFLFSLAFSKGLGFLIKCQAYIAKLPSCKGYITL